LNDLPTIAVTVNIENPLKAIPQNWPCPDRAHGLLKDKATRRTKMTIQVQVRSVYGNKLVYPMDEKAMLFARLLKTKTFTGHHMILIQELGYKIEELAMNGNIVCSYKNGTVIA
jgi:hypothetical protein